MKKSTLFALWGGMFILCAGLGFIPAAPGPARTLIRLLSLAFFLPPALVISGSIREKDSHSLRLIRNLSALSLGLSLLLLVLNILAAPASPALGDVLNSLLIIIAAPMTTSPSWALSLFLWACLLTASLGGLKKLR